MEEIHAVNRSDTDVKEVCDIGIGGDIFQKHLV